MLYNLTAFIAGFHVLQSQLLGASNKLIKKISMARFQNRDA